MDIPLATDAGDIFVQQIEGWIHKKKQTYILELTFH